MIEIVLQSIVLLGVLYLALFKSYFKEKGKNIATLEDIGKITTSVESIKAQLKFALEAKLSFRAEEHSALVDYYSKYYRWLSALMIAHFARVEYEQIDQLDGIRNTSDALTFKYNIRFVSIKLPASNR